MDKRVALTANFARVIRTSIIATGNSLARHRYRLPRRRSLLPIRTIYRITLDENWSPFDPCIVSTGWSPGNKKRGKVFRTPSCRAERCRRATVRLSKGKRNETIAARATTTRRHESWDRGYRSREKNTKNRSRRREKRRRRWRRRNEMAGQWPRRERVKRKRENDDESGRDAAKEQLEPRSGFAYQQAFCRLK